LSDADGNAEERSNTVSVFNGPVPTIQVVKDGAAETRVVSKWITRLIGEGVAPHEIGVFVRAPEQIDRARAAVKDSGVTFTVLDDGVDTTSGRASIGTMHLAKGLEFRAVAVMACDDEIIPLQSRIETVSDDSDLEEVYSTERHLLYVACTRARDHLMITAVDPGSEFLEDLKAQ
jgi:superfamily I DNA/RNA helicase